MNHFFPLATLAFAGFSHSCMEITPRSQLLVLSSPKSRTLPNFYLLIALGCLTFSSNSGCLNLSSPSFLYVPHPLPLSCPPLSLYSWPFSVSSKIEDLGGSKPWGVLPDIVLLFTDVVGWRGGCHWSYHSSKDLYPGNQVLGRFFFCRCCNTRTQLTLTSNRNPGIGSTQFPRSPPLGGILIFLNLRYLLLKYYFSLRPIRIHQYPLWKEVCPWLL